MRARARCGQSLAKDRRKSVHPHVRPVAYGGGKDADKVLFARSVEEADCVPVIRRLSAALAGAPAFRVFFSSRALRSVARPFF